MWNKVRAFFQKLRQGRYAFQETFPEGGTIPAGYGFAWYAYTCEGIVGVCYPIPFNVIMRWLYDKLLLLMWMPYCYHRRLNRQGMTIEIPNPHYEKWPIHQA